MALDVIGAGFGRTGTLSLKVALEQLGYGRCYHMMEVPGNPTHPALWLSASRGEEIDWEVLFEGYHATVDWPGCAFWQTLAARNPDAKILLTERDPDRWYESVMSTIYHAMVREVPDDAPELARQMITMVRGVVYEGAFSGRIEERDHAIGVYLRHNEAVRAAFTPERLLCFDVAQGWAPLCEFLGVAVPETDFPRINDRSSFRKGLGLDDEASDQAAG